MVKIEQAYMTIKASNLSGHFSTKINLLTFIPFNIDKQTDSIG